MSNVCAIFLVHLCQQGGYKLKIPTLLLNEKEKTRSRFSHQVRGCVCVCVRSDMDIPLSTYQHGEPYIYTRQLHVCFTWCV